MKLFCVRHGLAESLPDMRGDRPLTPTGRLEIQKLARYLSSKGISPAQIRHSDKARALETAKILAGSLLHNHQETEVCPLLDPEAQTLSALLALIQTSNENIMLVGHLPLISHLVSTLITTQNFYEIVAFNPGTVACLERQDNDHWVLEWVIHPELLTSEVEV